MDKKGFQKCGSYSEFRLSIETKSIHKSQTSKKKDGDLKVIQLEVKINYELIALIFSLGEHRKVIEPQVFVECIKPKAKLFNENYF
jgi:predicted DNA-binding transcriptional regulator YafY